MLDVYKRQVIVRGLRGTRDIALGFIESPLMVLERYCMVVSPPEMTISDLP